MISSSLLILDRETLPHYSFSHSTFGIDWTVVVISSVLFGRLKLAEPEEVELEWVVQNLFGAMRRSHGLLYVFFFVLQIVEPLERKIRW